MNHQAARPVRPGLPYSAFRIPHSASCLLTPDSCLLHTAFRSPSRPVPLSPCLLFLFLLLAAAAAPADAPPLPPGVRLEPLPSPEKLSPRLHAEMFSVDWTHPLLRVRLVGGVAPGRPLPLDWADAERARPEPLRIQLAEPVEQPRGGWALALPLAGPGGVFTEERPFFAVSALCPWLPGGPPLAGEPEYASSLTAASARAAVRWLGRLEDLEAVTTMTFSQRVLISWTRPDSGRSRFALVVHESGGAIQVQDLQAWLAAATAPADWLAFHSQGRYATVGVAGWRLGAEAQARRVERLGGVLELRALKPGEPADWARLPGALVAASTFETDYEPAHLLQGILGPAPFAPRLWISKEVGPAAPAEWVELDLGVFRPVDRLVLAWPTAVGWSAQFLPGRVVVKASLDKRDELAPLAEIAAPAGLTWEYRFPQTTLLRKVRVEFSQPSAMPLDRRARLAAVQLWGPWDGETGAR